MSTGFTTTSPNTSYSYAIQSGDGGVDGADSWNPDEFTPGDQHYGSISGRDIYSQFGRGVDTDFEGERLVGGGPNWSSGRGYIQVYDWSKALGSWASIAQIDGPVAGGWFGESVSMDYDGVKIVVGAPKANAVYICTPSISTGFAITQTINTSYASFGHCVSIAGDRADRFVVGAPAVNTIYVYEQNSVGNFAQVYSNVGTDIINDVPVNNGGSQRITLYSKFNGYGYSVKMSGFGYHIVVGSPGTELVEIQSSTQGGTTTPGALSHHLGDHMLSSTGPHYTGSTSYACNNQAAGNSGCVSASHPYSVYQVGTYTPARGTNGLRYADASQPVGQLHHYDRSPYGTNANNLADGYIFPNFQVGNIRILHCPDKGSWGSSVAAIGPVIKGRNVDTYNYMSNWSCIYRSLPGFGKSVSISVDGKRVTAGSPGYRAPGYDLQAAHGDTRYFVYNEIDDVYDEPMISRNATNTPSLGGPWSLIRTNQTWASWNLAMSEDGSRVFVGSRESSYSIVPYDFSGTTFYPVGPIVRSGGVGSGPGATTFGTVDPVPEIIDGFGYLSGYRNAAHNGASCVVTHPSYPQGFGRQAGSGGNTTPATSNGQGTGIILIYRFTLTSIFRGNSLFEGYVKCDNLTVGSSGGSVDHARIKFGGRKGENTTEAATTIESRWLGTHDGVYTGGNSVSAYKHDNELLISKFYSSLHLPNDTIKDGDDWNKRDFFGDRIRLKAPKIEFQLQTPQSDQQNNKYRESPCVTITEMNNPFGGQRGMSYISNAIADEPRQLVSIRTGTSNSRVQAGLRLIAGSLAGYTNAADSLVSSIPPDGDMYTFAPGNDGWLRLLCPVGQGQSVFYQTETNPQNTSKTITSNYAGVAVGDLYVGGTISGPGAPSGGGVTGLGSVTGNYGTVQTTGSSAGGWDGYSIHGRYVFMSAGTMAGGNHQCGIFNELDNNWILYFYRNTYVRLFYNGAMRLETTNSGITVMGSTYNTSDDRIKYNEEEVINCVNIINQLTPVKYEKLNQPEDIVGTWIPTDDEWESKKSNYGWYNEFGFIAQDVRKIPELSILVAGDEMQERILVKTELEYNKFSEEMRTKYTYRPDTEDYIHNDSGPTQVPLTINYTGFIPIITGAVKELSSALEQEKQKTENLQTRLTASEQAYQALLERVVALESA
jgi:hypothetical protein